MDIFHDTALNADTVGDHMEMTGHSQQKRHSGEIDLARGTAWGFVGGFTATLVMDLCLMGILSAAGLSALTCFSIVGDTVSTFFALLGADLPGGVALGVATHYSVGPAIGMLFGAAVYKVTAFRLDSAKKSVLLGVLYVELLSQPLLATTPLLLGMTAADTIQWYGGSFLMHLLAGAVLSLVVYYGLRPAAGSRNVLTKDPGALIEIKK